MVAILKLATAYLSSGGYPNLSICPRGFKMKWSPLPLIRWGASFEKKLLLLS